MSGRKHIFLSYSSQDGDFAIRLAVDLKNAGVNLWMDRLDINPGDDWRKTLEESINNSVAIVAVVSVVSVHSLYCQRELARADRFHYPIVPIKLTELADKEWPIEIERTQYIDFTHWHEELNYHQQLAKLVTHLKETFSAQITDPPNLEERYLTGLIAALKARNSVNALIETDVRPQPFSTFEWNLKTENTSRSRIVTSFVPNILHQRRTSIINQILKNFEEAPWLALLGEAGTGKTSLLEYLCLKFAYARQINATTEPLPILVRLAEWKDDSDFTTFLGQNLPFEIDIGQTVMLLDGLDEINAHQSHKIDQIRRWLRGNHKVIVTCRTDAFEAGYMLDNMLTVTAHNLQVRQVRVFLTSIFSAQRANQLLDEPPGKHLRPLIRNPRMLNILTNIQYRTPLENVGGALRQLVNELYSIEQAKSVYSTVTQSSLERTLAVLAAQEDDTLPYAKALEIAGDRNVLAFAQRANFLITEDDTIRFSYATFRSYFTAVWLNQNRVNFNTFKDRGDFAVIIACLVGITSDPDEFVKSICQDYPDLALQSLVADVSPETIKTVISYHLRAEELPDISALPNIEMFLETLISILQDETWDVRLSTHQIVMDMDLPLLEGITETLHFDEEERDMAAIAIKQIGTRALPTLIQHLQHPDPRLRSNVVWALGELASRAGVPGLVLALQDDDITVVINAIQALGYIHDPASFPALVGILAHPHQQVRDAAFAALQWARENALDAIIAGMTNDNLNVRMCIVDLLAESMQDKATDALLHATHDPNPDIKIGAVAALENRESAATIERLAECLEDKKLHDVATIVLKSYHSPAARAALEGNGASGKRSSAEIAKERLRQAVTANTQPPAPADAAPHSEILDGLLQRIRNDEWGEREEAVKALRNYAMTLKGENVPHILAQLRILLTDADWVLRWSAIEALSWIGHTSTVPDIITLLNDEYWMVRVAAIRGLVEIHDPAATGAIQTRLNDPNNVVREAALEALGYLGEEQVIPSIAAVLDDHDEMLRLAAVQALAHITQPASIPPLIKALHDADKHVRWAAVRALREIADASATSDLIRRLGDTEKPHWEQERICDLAAETLERIGTQRALEAVLLWKQKQSAADS